MKNLEIIKSNFNLKTEAWNEVEEKTYKLLNLDREETIYKNFTKIFENIVNEMITLDIDVIEIENPKVVINLSYLYNIELEHLDLEKVWSRILPRTKEKTLAHKIIKTNIIISTVFRCPDSIILDTIKKDFKNEAIWDEIKEKVRFNKGYLVILGSDTIRKLKDLEYTRKIIKRTPTEIKIIKENPTVLETLCNTTYSEKIWIRENELSLIRSDLDSYKIMNNNFNKPGKAEKIVKMLNYLNKIALTIDNNVFETIIASLKIKNKERIKSNKVIDNLYLIGKEEESLILDENLNVQKIVNSAACLALIKSQIKKFPIFFLEHNLDSRVRIYVNNWPINYQLNHIIRNSIKILEKLKIKEVLLKTKENMYFKKHYEECKDYIYYKIENQKLIDSYIEKMVWASEEEEVVNIKREVFLSLLIKTSKELSLENKIKEGWENFIEIKKIGSIKWAEKWKIKEKKIPYFINIAENLLSIEKNKFDNILWADASSNAIQLITLRLGIESKKLLMLTNIIENKTEHENIYEYVTSEFREKNHTEILKKIKNKISDLELNMLFTKEESKYLIMPASYGMGKFKNQDRLDESFKEKSESWECLEKKEKNLICDYIWDKCFESLKNIGFDLEEYKKKCKQIDKEYDGYMWENDVEIEIAPLTFTKSKRDRLKRKISDIKTKIKETKSNKVLNELKEKEKKIKNMIIKDEKEFWKRSMVKIRDREIYTRIFHRSTYKIDKRETRQALIPNTIHAYDASILNLVCEICEEIGINILVIHDSIGGQAIYMPIVKKIFKIANIELIERSTEKKPFPFDKTNISKKMLKEIKREILESTNFFR